MILGRMRQSLVYRPHYRCDRLFIDNTIAATRVHLGIVQAEEQPFSRGDVHLWFDGELYPAPSQEKITAHELLLSNYSHDNLFPFLHTIDGIFTAVIYDGKKQTLLLISDRYGLRHLYYCADNAGISWASEIKVFKHLPGQSLDVNPDRVSEFIHTGYFSGNSTWFDAVKLLEPATVLSWDIKNASLERKQYWNWGEIKPMRETIAVQAVSEALGIAFKKAVQKRCRIGERIGLGLSGGLDSRAIFASLPSFTEPIKVITFGREGCNDIHIARQVAALRPSSHCILPIGRDNWLNNRREGIWLTDGQINLLHMHGIEQIDDIRDFFDIGLNGFLGDALLGGSYGGHTDDELARYADRGRRFIAMGLSLDNIAIHTRIPFFDNDLMELTMSIPMKYRRGSFIYNRMLLETFPDFFRSIPWQKTGMPISAAGPFWETIRFIRRCYYKAQRKIASLPGNIGYTDYPFWIRGDPARTFFSDLLTSKSAMLYEYIDPNMVTAHLSRHFAGLDYTELLGRYVTLEIWMRQFFKGELMEIHKPADLHP